jgi:2-oxoglutarate ferredoxin oxidoreductase subunit delta
MAKTELNRNIQIQINEQWCKGCAICVEMCPHDVLVMENSLVKIKNLAACTGCNLCELHCPDFAIVVNTGNGKQQT